MKTKSFWFATLAGALSACAVVWADEAAQVVPEALAEKPSPASLGVRIGPAWRHGSKISGVWAPETLRGYFPAAHSSSSAGQGGGAAATGYIDRDYDDGYVHTDAGTLDPDTEIYGTTWNWGYDSASQYDGSTVSFSTGGGGYSSSFRPVAAPDETFGDDVGTLGGWEVGGDWMRLGANSVRFGFAAAARFFSGESARFTGSALMGRETYSSYSYVDVYDAHWADFPGAPYAGTSEGPGYLLDAEPMYRGRVAGPSSHRDWTAHSSAKADLDEWDLRFGPAAGWRPLDWLRFDVAAQFLLARASLDLASETEIRAGGKTVAAVRNDASADKWLPGFSLGISVSVVLPFDFTLSASVAREWFDGRPRVSAGPFSVAAELGETTYSLCIGKEF